MTDYKRVFFDTAPIIYFLEENATFYDRVAGWIEKTADAQFISSTIMLIEYLTYPYRNGDKEMVSLFHRFIDDYEFTINGISAEIADKAAQIRAEYEAFKTMDAIQLATATVSDCDVFLTNDAQLRQFKEIEVITVRDL